MTVRFEADGDVGVITLAAPPLNLLGGEVQAAFHAALDQAVRSGSRAVLVRAEGPNFSAGAQVQGLAARGSRSTEPQRPGIVARLEALAVPVVAAVQGNCLGGGFEVALGCDLIWAADDAKIGLVETGVGMYPIGGGVQRLAHRIGVARAKQVAFDGSRHPAGLWAEWGVVARICPAASLHADALAQAHRLAAGPTVAYGAIKQLAAAAVNDGVVAADALSAHLIGAVIASDDAKAGIKSLLENGPGRAVFAGR
jgi:enoyl-CoA hydratase/carnithine racemase